MLADAAEDGSYAADDGCYFLAIPTFNPEAATLVVQPGSSSMVELTRANHNYEDLTVTKIPIGKVLDGVMVEDFRNVTGIAAYE